MPSPEFQTHTSCPVFVIGLYDDFTNGPVGLSEIATPHLTCLFKPQTPIPQIGVSEPSPL